MIWKIYGGIPEPVTEYKFWPGRRFRFDYAWLKAKVAVEIEGGIWIRGRHSRGPGMMSDMEKYNEATRMGWRVFRFTPTQLKNGEVQRYIQEVLTGCYE